MFFILLWFFSRLFVFHIAVKDNKSFKDYTVHKMVGVCKFWFTVRFAVRKTKKTRKSAQIVGLHCIPKENILRVMIVLGLVRNGKQNVSEFPMEVLLLALFLGCY